MPIHIYYWRVSNIVPPNVLYTAIFSYTILASRRDDPQNLEEVRLSAAWWLARSSVVDKQLPPRIPDFVSSLRPSRDRCRPC